MTFMNMKLWTQLFLILLFAVLLAACGNVQNTPVGQVTPRPQPSATTIPTPVPTDIFFPQAQEPAADHMLALLVGKLILVDGCPHAQVIDGSSILLFWPYNYSIDRSANPAQIRDDRGRVVARIGDYVTMGGGEIPGSDSPSGGCSGPYHVVGEGPTVLDAFFPQLGSGGAVSTTDFLEGKLLLVSGCLRLQVSENVSSLLIWPVGFSLNREEDPMQVYDGAGRVEAHVGEKIRVRGGEPSYLKPPPGELTELVLVQPLPNACSSGPYWVVDYIP